MAVQAGQVKRPSHEKGMGGWPWSVHLSEGDEALCKGAGALVLPPRSGKRVKKRPQAKRLIAFFLTAGSQHRLSVAFSLPPSNGICGTE